jgi:hypothetical protein
MRGVTLAELVRRLRVQLSHSANVAHGLATQENLEEHLRMAQDWLWDNHDWEHLDVSRDIVMANGTRYYSVPSDMVAERVNNISFKDGSDWVPVCYGIEPEDFNVYDSDAGIKSWPVMKWRFAERLNPSSAERIEVWPIPSQNGNTTTKVGCLRLRGIRTMVPMVTSSDKCELDSNLIVLTAAIRLVARQNQQDAERLSVEAEKLRLRLQGNGTAKKRRHTFGVTGDHAESRSERRFDYVRL